MENTTDTKPPVSPPLPAPPGSASPEDAALELWQLKRTANTISELADIVDRQLGVEPNRVIRPELRISHQVCGLLEALADAKRKLEAATPNAPAQRPPAKDV